MIESFWTIYFGSLCLMVSFGLGPGKGRWVDVGVSIKLLGLTRVVVGVMVTLGLGLKTYSLTLPDNYTN